MLGLLVFAIGGFFTVVGILLGDDYEGGDGGGEYGYYYVDQRSVLKAVDDPCEDMIDAGRKIKPFDDPGKAAPPIRAFAVSAQKVADAIGTANPNADSQLWREDWEALAEALDTYADDLVSVGSNAAFTSLDPMDEAPLMFRMALSSDADCEVPAIVVAFDTVNAGTYYDYYE